MSERLWGLAFLAFVFVGLIVLMCVDGLLSRRKNRKKNREEAWRREFFKRYEEARRDYV